MMELLWGEIKRRRMDGGWGEGNMAAHHSPPVPPFLHPTPLPSPSAPRSALPSQLHPDMLTHHAHALMVGGRGGDTRMAMAHWSRQ